MEVQLFQNDDFKLQVYGTTDNPLIKAADLCKLLGIVNPSHAITRLDEDEHQRLLLPDAHGRPQSYQVVTEPGVWNIILSSNKAKVKGTDAWKLKRWVTHEVLPAIRRKGKYELTQTVNQLTTQTKALTIRNGELAELGKQLTTQTKQLTTQTKQLTELTDMLMNRRFHKVATKLLGDHYDFNKVKKLPVRHQKLGGFEFINLGLVFTIFIVPTIIGRVPRFSRIHMPCFHWN